MAQDCARHKKTIKAKSSRTGKAITFMAKPQGCGTPKYEHPSKAQLQVRRAIAKIGKECKGVGEMGGKKGGGMDREKKACIRSASAGIFG